MGRRQDAANSGQADPLYRVAKSLGLQIYKDFTGNFVRSEGIARPEFLALERATFRVSNMSLIRYNSVHSMRPTILFFSMIRAIQRYSCLRLAAYIAFIALMAKPVSAQVNWIQVKQFPAADGYVSAMWFFNSQVGVVGFHWNISTSTNGCVQWTTDGGVTWTNSSVPTLNNTTPQITDIWFSDSLRGWLNVSGNLNVGDPCLWRTTDGGKTWKPNPKNPSMAFGHLACVRQTDTALIVTGDLGVGLWASTDSGFTWMQHQTLRNNGLAFHGHDVVATEFGQKSSTTFLLSSDGGITWVNSVGGFQHEGWGVYHIPNSSTFIAAPEDTTVAGVSQRSYIYRSTDEGRDWTRTQLPINTTGDVEGVEGILYVQNSGGISGSTQGLFESTDGGLTWNSVGGPNQGAADPYRICDTRFAVTGCGNIVYASDGSAGLWKTVNAPGLHLTNKDTLRPMTAMLCDTTKQLFYLHESNSSSIIIQDIRILDTLRRPFATGAVWVDSLPSPFMSIQVGDSVPFGLAWHPGAMMDSAASDSATIRVIFYATYLVPCVSAPALAYDTVFLHVKLIGTTAPAEYATKPHAITTDTLPLCIAVDTTVLLVNQGCDSLTLTKATLAKNNWTLSNAAGTPLKLPLRIGGGDTIRLRLRATPTNAQTLFDSLKVTMHYMGHDTGFGVALRTTAKLSNSLATPTTFAFDSVAICDSIDKVITLMNSGCDTLLIKKADLTDSHFELLDTNGKPLQLPLVVVNNPEGRNVLIRFVPGQLGGKSGNLLLHYHYFGFDSTNAIALSGTGASTGALSYSNAMDFSQVAVCGPGYHDSTFTFTNTTCGESILIDSLALPPSFTILDPQDLPKTLKSGESLALRIRYQPSGKRIENGKALLKAAIHNGTQVVYDSILFAGIGVPGPSNFNITPAIQASTFDFGTKSECDRADSITVAIYNTGCDTTTITSLSLDPSLTGAFTVHTDRAIPAKLAPATSSHDTLHVTVAITSLAANTYNGNLTLLYTLSNGSSNRTTAPIKMTVTQSGGARALTMTTPTNFRFDTIRACSSRDTSIQIANTGCGTDTVLTTITGNGFVATDTTYITPGATASIHVRYDGSTRGNVNAIVSLKTGQGVVNNLANVSFDGYVPPTDSVHFLVSFDKAPVSAGTFFRVLLKPDRAVTGVGLNSIRGIFSYPSSTFIVGTGALSAASGLMLSQNGPEIVTGGLGHFPFEVTNASGITLDPATPIVTFAMEAVVSDSVGGKISVDSLQLNHTDPQFSVCNLAAGALGLTSAIQVLCGDSTLIRTLGGKPIISSEQLRPNPVTSETGYKSSLQLLAGEDGVAEVTLYNALGEVISHDALALKHRSE